MSGCGTCVRLYMSRWLGAVVTRGSVLQIQSKMPSSAGGTDTITDPADIQYY